MVNKWLILKCYTILSLPNSFNQSGELKTSLIIKFFRKPTEIPSFASLFQPSPDLCPQPGNTSLQKNGLTLVNVFSWLKWCVFSRWHSGCLSVVLCRCERVVPLTVLTTDVPLGLTLNVHSEHGTDLADTSQDHSHTYCFCLLFIMV